MFSGKPDKSLTWTRESADNVVLYGKHVLVVGGTGGIGQALARLMAKQGADVTAVGRSFRDTGISGLHFVQADLSSMADTKLMAESLPAELFHLVVFAAGGTAAPTRKETDEGIEEHLAVGYLSRIAMLRKIASRLGANRGSSVSKPRVFIMGYPGANIAGNVTDLNCTECYRPRAAHLNVLAGNEALVYDTETRYSRINVYGLNPGLIKPPSRREYRTSGAEDFWSRMVESMSRVVGITPEAYALKTLPLLVSGEIEDASGSLFNQNGNAILRSNVMTDDIVRQYTEVSERLLDEARDSFLPEDPNPLPYWLCPPQYQRQSRTPLPI